MTNPLIAPWPGPFGGVPPWDLVRPEHFPEAFDAALAAERDAVAAIAANPAPADFANTLEPLERSRRLKDRVLRVFNVLRLNTSTPELQALDKEWQPRLAAAEDAVTFHPGLFERIDQVYQALPSARLSPEQARLTTRIREEFVRSGARLAPEARTRLSALNQALAALYADFRARVMASENSWTLLRDEADLEGLPPSLLAAAAEAARER